MRVHRFVCVGLCVAVWGLGSSAGMARADLVFTLQESGPNVTLTSAGSVTFIPPARLPDGLATPQAAALFPSAGSFVTGTPPYTNGMLIFDNVIVSGPTSFGTNPGIVATTVRSGPVFGLGYLDGTHFNAIGLDSAEVSALPIDGGQIFAGNATFLNTTIAAMAVTPGTYVWKLNSLFNNETVTLRIIPSAVPEPSSLVLMGLAALGAAGYGGVARFRSRARA